MPGASAVRIGPEQGAKFFAPDATLAGLTENSEEGKPVPLGGWTEQRTGSGEQRGPTEKLE